MPDGSKYVGEYKVGKKDGQGTYTYANGNNYIVEWKDREYVGWGTYTRAKGSMFVREFKYGNLWSGTYFD